MLVDKILLEGVIVYGFHGVHKAERDLGQRFIVDLEVEHDLETSGRSDDIKDTLSYSEVFSLVRSVIKGSSKNLLESLAESIAERIFQASGEVTAVKVRVKKPDAPIKDSVISYAGVEIYRTRR